jgi:hypothetical protein
VSEEASDEQAELFDNQLGRTAESVVNPEPGSVEEIQAQPVEAQSKPTSLLHDALRTGLGFVQFLGGINATTLVRVDTETV